MKPPWSRGRRFEHVSVLWSDRIADWNISSRQKLSRWDLTYAYSKNNNKMQVDHGPLLYCKSHWLGRKSKITYLFDRNNLIMRSRFGHMLWSSSSSCVSLKWHAVLCMRNTWNTWNDFQTWSTWSSWKCQSLCWWTAPVTGSWCCACCHTVMVYRDTWIEWSHH